MTLPFAILLVIILIIYNAVFLRMQFKRKGREVFSISIEDGEIKKGNGKVPDIFMSQAKILCETYRPGLLKISAVILNDKTSLQFSGAASQELKDDFNQLFNSL